MSPRRAATSSASSRRRKRVRDDEDEDEDDAEQDGTDDAEGARLFLPQDAGPCLSRKFARTMWSDVKATSKLKYDGLDEALRAKLLGELVQYIIFKGTRAEPIVKGSIKRDCRWTELASYEHAWLDALLAEGKRLFDSRDDLVEPIPRRGSTTGSSYTPASS